jgi:hypothetical protein
MMAKKIIMTTRFQIFRADNVFHQNDVLLLEGVGQASELALAAVAWILIGESPREAHWRSLSHAAKLVDEKLDEYALFLLAGHACWRPNSAVPRYRKFWGALKARGLQRPSGRDLGEYLVEGPEGLRYFSGVQIEAEGLDAAVAILAKEQASHLVALKRSDEQIATALVRSGWSWSGMSNTPNAEVLRSVCGADGIVFWPVGAFDDREAGCVALARRDVLDLLLGTRRQVN